MILADIVEDLEAALEQFREIESDLKEWRPRNPRRTLPPSTQLVVPQTYAE